MLAANRPALAATLFTRRPPSLLLGKQAPMPRRRPSLAAPAADGRAPSSGGKSSSSANSSSANSDSRAGTATTTATTTAATAANSSSSASGPLLIHASLAARPGLCDGGLPDVDMCLIDSDDDEMRAEEGAAAVMAAAQASASPGPSLPSSLQQQLPSPSPPPSPGVVAPPPGLPSPLHVPPAPDSMLDEAASRGRWLVGLLVVQSFSSVVLERFEPLIREHLAVTLFLTMLVGAGGNAGNQSAIKVIRGLATGQLDASWPSARAALSRQAGVALVLGGGLAAAGYARVIIAAALGGLGGGGAGGGGDGGGAGATALVPSGLSAPVVDGAASLVDWADASRDAAAISVSLLAIVFTSILLGTALPFALARCGVDAAHAGTTIQVASDVLGVLVTCLACSFFYSGAMDAWTDGIGVALAGVF